MECKMKLGIHACNFCEKSFTVKSNLKRHTSKVHDLNTAQSYICYHCSHAYTSKYNLIRHISKCGKTVNKRTPPGSKEVGCILCNNYTGLKINLVKHYNLEHGINISTENLQFPSFAEFEAWKEQTEDSTISKYIRHDSIKSTHKVIYYYRCHRDGFYQDKGKHIRRLKLKGSNKINGYCPSKITATVTGTGEVHVLFVMTHVGHTSDLEKIPLKYSVRNLLASKISQKIPFDEIMNTVRDSFDHNNYSRIHLLTRKDLYNIEQLYKLNKESVHHDENDCTSIESWVLQLREQGTYSIVRYFKRQGDLDETHTGLLEKDFLLVIMNEGQLEALKKYGSNCLCVDSILGLDAYNFQLTTLMVLDDLRQGFPCMFAFSNRSDTYAMKVIFSVVRSNLDSEISPRIFMSSMDDIFYNGWCEIMGPVDIRLFCTWHVITAWKSNINVKINDPEKQKNTYKILRTLLEETDKVAFERMLPVYLDDLYADLELHGFVDYFKNHFVENRKLWASCYRQYARLDTNMHLERMHKTLQYIYLKGQKVRRLDKAISELMNTVRDKLFEHLTTSNRGKLSKKLSDLRKRHKEINSMTNSTVILEVEDGRVWTISSSKGNYIYTIEILNKLCNCDLTCDECNACIHMYVCSCPDSAIRWNMCKHIHFLCAHLQKPNIPVNVMNDSDLLEVGEQYENHYNEEDIVIRQLSNSYTFSPDVTHYKEKLHELFQSILGSANTSEQCREVERALIPLQSTLSAMNFENVEGNEQSSVAITAASSSGETEKWKIDPEKRFGL